MKLFKYNKFNVPKNAKFSQTIKKIGKVNLKHININIKEMFWHSKDGPWYILCKRKFDWNKLKVLLRGFYKELESGSESTL